MSWQVYQEWDNFNDNAVEYFAVFKRIGTKALSKVKGKFGTTEEFYYALFDKSPSARKKMLDQFAAGLATLTPAERVLFDRGMYRSEPDTLVPRLRADIAAGTLPAVSYLVPTAALSEHPGSSTPVGSANLIYQVLDAIASNPDTWSKTVLLINFDENDGYFDHVPAPVQQRPGSGASDDWYQGRAIGLGPRVPMTVVSPWTIGGHVDSEIADHTSVIRFLERVTGVVEPNISPWRRQLCGDLTAAFDFAVAGTRPALDQPGPIPPAITRWRPTPPAQGVLPAQEPGRRPARALPYQPRVSAVVEAGTLRLALADTGTGASHFAIYPYSGEFAHPEHRDVATEHVEPITVPAAGYRLAVQGPNRFWYELAGTATGAAAGVAVRSPHLPAGGGAAIELSNTGASEVTLTLTAARYGTSSRTVTLAAGASTSVVWPTDGGWYDVEVTAAQDPTFRRRLTGRVEDGAPGVTA
ncbi:phospholipase C [Actinokineospora alba]|uniref:Phospholipase C n=1 Tax=Actinokineospora alba TaxID=504798 RepID=A0A1H0EU23_9PSEU|nr:alkaline phosphatase family protein [Actinokineospora alba]SDI21536.1 phospholipase C [Actinokineospora alba]SDN85880.1 phospholipase C [Actinokineospora alba]